MILDQISKIQTLCISLQNALKDDIEDVKNANHDSLMSRNTLKLNLMENIQKEQNNLKNLLAKELQNGNDIEKYRNKIDILELDLKEIYTLNTKLSMIVLPIKEMYTNIIDEITKVNGGSLIEVNA